MKKITILILASCLIASPAMAVHKIGSVILPDFVRLEKNELFFNGAGIFRKSLKKLFVCALYLKEKKEDAAAIIHADEPMVMRFHITSSLVTREKLLESISNVFHDSKDTTDSLQTGLKELDSLLRGEIRTDDIIELSYLPGKGVLISHNDQYLGSIKSFDFKEAFFSLWLGEKPIDSTLKKSLLKGPQII